MRSIRQILQSTLQSEEYPYVFARVAVMRSQLIKPQRYEELLKMGFGSVLHALERFSYKREINELSLRRSGIDLAERALHLNLSRTFRKLRLISHDSLRSMIDVYMLRRDIQNVKTILRSKNSGIAEEEIRTLFSQGGLLSQKRLDRLLTLPIPDVIQNLNLHQKEQFAKALEEYRQKASITALEGALDEFYLRALQSVVGRLPLQSDFRNYINTELTGINILSLLRLKREGLSAEDIRSSIFLSEENRGLLQYVSLPDVNTLISRLENSKYGRLIQGGIASYRKTGSLIPIELAVYKYLLKKTQVMAHADPFSADVILSYMFQKEIEVRNLMLILKGTLFGFDEQFIREQLVI